MYFKWEKYDSVNNSWISSSHTASSIMSFDLKFSVITEDDEGVYRCVVTNNDGSVISDNATIHVYGKCSVPSPKQIVMISITIQALQLLHSSLITL